MVLYRIGSSGAILVAFESVTSYVYLIFFLELLFEWQHL
jgi:hypothetical protein